MDNALTARTQRRASCPACFATQAIRTSGRMVDHGYRRPQHWGGNVGTCDGAGAMHFGTEAGRAFAAAQADRMRVRAADLEVAAEEVAAGTGSVYGRKMVGRGTYMPTVVENPTPDQRARYAALLRSHAESFRAQATEQDARVAAWQPAEPREVAVESKPATVHFRTKIYGHAAHACAASAMGAQRFMATTENVDAVTCERCKQRKSYQAAIDAAQLSREAGA